MVFEKYLMSRPVVMHVTDGEMNLADIANMRKDLNPGSSRPKPRNDAGLFLVGRNELTCASHASQQYPAVILPRHLCWTAFGTFMVGVLCLLIK